MSNVIAACLIGLVVAVGTQEQGPTASEPSLSLESLQGAWWSDCREPAAEFAIQGSKYFGDFHGSYSVELTGDVLVFHDGLASGHSVDVTRTPLSFRVVDAGPGMLVLRPAGQDGNDWHLKSCSSIRPND